MESMAEREARLNDPAVDLVTGDHWAGSCRADGSRAVATLLRGQLSVGEIAERCGLSVKEVARLKRIHLEVGVRECPPGARRGASDPGRSGQP